MFWIEYFCPRQSPYWQRGNAPMNNFVQACMMARALKPGRGSARVVDAYGVELFRV